MTDLQGLQKQIEKAQEDLKATTAEYSRMAMEKKIEEPPLETAMEEDELWHILKEAGVAVEPRQNEQMQKLQVEQTKRRKTEEKPEEGKSLLMQEL